MTYESLIRNLRVAVSNSQVEWLQVALHVLEPAPGGVEMLVSGVLGLICTAGIGFYARFLVELCKEPKRQLRRYCVLLPLGSEPKETVALREHDTTIARAA